MSESVIVFPTDFSSQSLAAVEWARKMAAAENAQIHCIYSIEMPHYYGAFVNSAAMMPSANELQDYGSQRMTEFLDQHAAQFDRPPVTAVLVGKPSIQIVDYAREHDAVMIVMSTHGYRGMRHAVLGSTTESVLRDADCPVLVIRSKG
ncbi:MAG: universal stress protein [Gammaproteobacteria bacterium]|nr:universal stress protein [Gammaproteobacteria bacterium]